MAACAPEMFEALKEAYLTISELRTRMMSWSDYTNGTYFDEDVLLSKKAINKIEQLLKKATQ